MIPQEALQIICAGLESCIDVLAHLPDGNEIVTSGVAFGDAKNDTEIKADKILGRHLTEFLSCQPSTGSITVEGCEDFYTDLGVWYTVDPLDGSLNYRTKGDALGLPYSACITALFKKPAVFGDILAAGIIDLRSGNMWAAAGDEQTIFYKKSTHEKVPVRTSMLTNLDLGSQIVIGEFYYPENREKLVRAFAGKKGWLRNPGSAAYEMALVANGTAIAFICDRQKQHELGAGYLLVKQAGGTAVDFDGKPLCARTYDFKTQTPVILAANQKIADEIVELLIT